MQFRDSEDNFIDVAEVSPSGGRYKIISENRERANEAQPGGMSRVVRVIGVIKQ